MIIRQLIAVLILVSISSCNQDHRNSYVQSAEPQAKADSLRPGIPFAGAQVFIEPGQTPEEIDTWFRLLRDNNFSVCRIRMFESYMRKEDGSYDFSLFDNAFRSAEKYGIKVFGTIFPYTEKTDIGGFKFPRDEAHLQSVAAFIKVLTSHFSRFKSLYGWVLINEPGTGGKVPWNDFLKIKYVEWLTSHPKKEFNSKGYPVLVDLSEQAFLVDLNTWYLKWLADEIRKYDTVRQLHVNNHAIFQNCAEYNFPEWRKFLSSLGGSAHAAWHFGYFNRDQYAVAMSANSEIIRSGAGDIPWFMTELQGGNNTYSGGAPMCPTMEETVQWLWIIYASEGKGTIFWTLNPRSSGIEAGEWALLDFQDKPSDRMKAAAKVAGTLNLYPELFTKYREAGSGIDILYLRQSLWAEGKMAAGSKQNYEARNPGGVMKSSLGYYEALCEMGVNAGFRAFEEYDFSMPDYTGKTIILSHQICMPGSYVSLLENFVSRGGKLIVDGLSGFYDPDMVTTLGTGSPFAHLLGGDISEYKAIDNLFQVPYKSFNLPAHLWCGFITNVSGEVISLKDGNPVAVRNRIGSGEVIWIPSLIGLGSRISGDYSALQGFLKDEASASLKNIMVKFTRPVKGWLMKTMISGNSLITIIINKSGRKGEAMLDFKGKDLKGKMIYPDRDVRMHNSKIRLMPEETTVIVWKGNK